VKLTHEGKRSFVSRRIEMLMEISDEQPGQMIKIYDSRDAALAG
jgi:hypothetical protein